jgi:hypothetical protein
MFADPWLVQYISIATRAQQQAHSSRKHQNCSSSESESDVTLLICVILRKQSVQGLAKLKRNSASYMMNQL